MASPAASDESGGWWNEARRDARRLRARLLAPDNGASHNGADALLGRATEAARLMVRRRPPGDALLCGAHAVLDWEAETIWVRNNASSYEHRLFVAHELGHFFLHGGASGDLWQTGCFIDADTFSQGTDGLVIVGYGPAQRRETEANVWAREFLLPAPVAHTWFASDGLTAPEIARRAGLPLSVTYAQLAAGLTSTAGDETEAEPPAALGASGETESLSVPPPPLTLDETQHRAATQETGPTLTHAGPGTGKTRTLTARILFLTLEKNVRPENILVLTFGRKAAGELRERVALYAPQTARRIFISTFHAYGYDLLRRFSTFADLPTRPVLLEKADAFALMERHLAACDLQSLRYLHDPAFPLSDLLRVINQAKEEGIGPEELARRAQASGDPKHEEAARVFACYEVALHEHGAIDYSDLVGRAVRLLTENDDVRSAERSQWQHVLVDEYQDVNRGGAHLLQALTGTGEGLWAVGDVRQAIYQFRGASPANVARFDGDFPGGTRTDLGVNYRSAPSLVSLLGTVCGEGVGAWQAARTTGSNDTTIPHAVYAVAGDERAQWDGIARKIRHFMEAGYAGGDIAVLCRTNNQAKEAQAMLVNRGIPCASASVAAGESADAPGGILAHPDTKKLLALLSRACDTTGTARNHYPEIPADLLDGIGGSGSGDAHDFLADVLWGTLGWARSLSNPAVVAALLNLARSFRDRAPLITGKSRESDNRQAFVDHLRRMASVGSPSLALPDVSAASEEKGEAAASFAGVRVMTIHAAKGLEFPVVFVPNLSVGKFPSRPAPALIAPVPSPPEGDEAQTDNVSATNDENAVDREEIRLFFVALSRAQNALILSRAEKYNNRRAQASPLLVCIEDAKNAGLLHGEAWPTAASVPTAATEDDASTTENIAADGQAAPPVMVEAWEVDLYLRCPRRYYFERVAGLASRGDESPYQAFKRVVDAALAAPNALGAVSLLATLWAENDLLQNHPYAPLYRQSAEAILRRHYEAGENGEATRRLEPLTPFVIEREHGGIVVRAEQKAAGSGGGVVFRTFRKTPSRSASAEAELRHILLQEAQPNVTVRYIQSGNVLPVTVTAAARKTKLAHADRALKGIRLRVFAPDPADPKECPACPYFFVCP